MESNDNTKMSALGNVSDVQLAAVELFKGYPDSLLQAAVACCVIFILIGIPGNLITIVALASSKKFRNSTAIFIINLHVSNLIYCCMILPMTAAVFSEKHWIYGHIMCKVYPLMKYVLSGTALYTVLAITVNRYIMVCHPLIYPKFYKKYVLIITLVITWVASFAMFLPSFFGVWGQFDLDQIRGICSLVPDKNNVSPKMFFLCCGFLGPYIIICICYGRIWWTVRKTTKKRNNHNAKAMQPTMSTSTSDPSVVDNARLTISGQPPVDDSGTDDDSNKNNSSIALTPSGRASTVVQFFRTPIRFTKKAKKVQLPSRKDKKLATMILAIIVSFTICHLPLILMRVLKGEYKSDPNVKIFTQLLEYSSAFISPIIYVIMSNEYRQAYTSLFKRMKDESTQCFKGEP